MLRQLWTVLIGLALAVLVVGLALIVVTQPPVTRALAGRYSLSKEAALPAERMLALAEQVRAFVAGDSDAPLPSTVDGRPGFDAAAVSHLADVRAVIAGARTVTWALALLVSAWAGVELLRGRRSSLSAGLRAGAWWCGGFVVLGALAGLADFEALFTAFHGVFFAEGTWTFAADSLLIQTFPESFWASAAAVWATLVVLGAALLAVAARLLSSGRAPDARSGTPSPSANGA